MKKKLIDNEDIIKFLNNLLKENFNDLSALKINFSIVKGKGFFMATPILPKLFHYFFGYKIRIHKSALKMPVDAFIGCLAHELEHISYNQLSIFNYYKHDEREIDFNVIAKGLGNELFAFIKYHDSIYEDYTKEDGLTKKEIKKLIKIYNHEKINEISRI